ncbi:MAG: family 10 glycosylhydrolase [Cyanobacteria bacterium]|nr:family 10 glycosylhydrolase [Cyanobacteria bacterium CG_2015-16_32_12]NCO78595.1 family 10 glycosylhydrolase [Cyanobacteria bacterium CG_2015-22_32_23]NCQ02987.1 family 10 glycosylhydrolase [Cyanobacteria bacterium CG_2015-09_32_10]NCQ40392.1 family 10 glycosylhydrolase [Cyanobacteria bacterium CG_2015-04_32_10]NCS83678.1 family 10 glycosylhydrolase [Cyanobacteria bacterium CG_2015-02_32_10]
MTEIRSTLIKLVIIFFLTVTFTISISQFSNSQSVDNQEIRGVWLTNIDSDVLFTANQTKKAIATLDKLNFNSLYPTVWNWGHTLYPSQVAENATGIKVDPTEALKNRDVLQEIISESHKKKIAVIPWFEFGFMAPADSSLAKKHPQWLTQREDGSKIWLEGNVHERVWLNPLNPQVQSFITDLILEIVTKYDIDGIQVDDHFGYPSELGYDPYTVALYRKEHDGKLPPLDSKNPEWIQWRSDKITAYMETLFRLIKDVKKNVIISVSPNPQEFSKNEFLMDWATWERKGLIEELIVQIYRNNMESFNGELAQKDLQLAKNHIPSAIGILSGLKGKKIDLNLINDQVRSTRDKGFSGFSFFFYESLWNFGPETVDKRQNYFRDIFAQKVNRSTINN